MLYCKPIQPEIQKTLIQRINAMARENNFKPPALSALSENKNNSVNAMLTSAYWIRVTAAIPNPKYTDNPETKDVEEKELRGELLRLSGHFKNGQPINKPLTSRDSVFTNDPDMLFRPPTGVTSISTQFLNQSIQQVEINWSLHNIDDFSKYQSGFLKHGQSVLVEFGWSSPDEIDIDIPKDANTMLEYYENIQEKIRKGGGNYYATMGMITGFDWKVKEGGALSCTTTLKSMGNSLFTGTTESKANDYTPAQVKKDNAKTLQENFNKSALRFEKFMENIEAHLKKEYDTNPNKHKEVYHIGDKGWCTWGWFEDNVLNTYFALTTKKGESSKPNTTEIRSMYKDEDEESPTFGKQLPTFCRNNENLYSMNTDVILPGQNIAVNSLKTIGVEGTQDGKHLFTEDRRNSYQGIFEIFTYMDENFHSFRDSNEPSRGIIRNIVFSGDFLKQNFSGIRSLNGGLKSLWSSISSQYGGYWNFKVVQDDNHNGRVGVTEEYGGVAKPKITQYNPFTDVGRKNAIDPSQEGNIQKLVEKASNPSEESLKDFSDKCFVFPVNSYKSLFKSFDVDVQISAQQATMAMFHGNKSIESDSDDNYGKPDELGLTALGLLQNPEFTYESQVTDTTNKITEVYYPYQKGKKYTRDKDNPTSKLVLKEISEEDVTISEVNQQAEEIEAELNQKTESKEITDDKGANWIKDKPDKQVDSEEPIPLIYTPDGQMMESYKRGMRYHLNQRPGFSVGMAPLVQFNCSFTMVGIGGIRMYDLFAVDYLPEYIRPYALFQVVGIEHTIDNGGWDTNITGQMRVDMDALTTQRVLDNDATIKPVKKPKVNTDTKTFLLEVQKQEDEQTEADGAGTEE